MSEQTAVQRPYPTPGYHVEELDGEILLFNMSSQKILHTNQTGALVWKLCDGQHTAEEIVQLLQAAYPDAADPISEEVPRVLEAFAAEGALAWR
jgi:hypothetical protein